MDFNKRGKLNYVFPKYRNPMSSKCNPWVYHAVILGGTAIANLSRKTTQLGFVVHTRCPRKIAVKR